MDSIRSDGEDSWIDRVPAMRAGLAVTSLATAGIHFAVIGEHFAEYVAFGIFFSVVAWLQALWGLAVAVAPRRRLLFSGLVGNAFVAAVWIVSRTSGLPIGPQAGTPERVSFLDALSTALELAIIAASAVLLIRRRPLDAPRGRRPLLAVAVLTLALGFMTTAAIATDAGHHDASDQSGSVDHHQAP